MSKSIFRSKTFWLNVLGLAVNYGGLLPVKYSVPVMAIANVGVRLLTYQPVTVLPDATNR